MWTFLKLEVVEPTNNAAERALRLAVLSRERCFGTQKDGGTRSLERLLTAVATCTQHGRPLLAHLAEVCTAAHRGQPIPSLLPATA